MMPLTKILLLLLLLLLLFPPYRLIKKSRPIDTTGWGSKIGNGNPTKCCWRRHRRPAAVPFATNPWPRPPRNRWTLTWKCAWGTRYVKKKYVCQVLLVSRDLRNRLVRKVIINQKSIEFQVVPVTRGYIYFRNI